MHQSIPVHPSHHHPQMPILCDLQVELIHDVPNTSETALDKSLATVLIPSIRLEIAKNHSSTKGVDKTISHQPPPLAENEPAALPKVYLPKTLAHRSLANYVLEYKSNPHHSGHSDL